MGRKTIAQVNPDVLWGQRDVEDLHGRDPGTSFNKSWSSLSPGNQGRDFASDLADFVQPVTGRVAACSQVWLLRWPKTKWKHLMETYAFEIACRNIITWFSSIHSVDDITMSQRQKAGDS